MGPYPVHTATRPAYGRGMVLVMPTLCHDTGQRTIIRGLWNGDANVGACPECGMRVSDDVLYLYAATANQIG